VDEFLHNTRRLDAMSRTSDDRGTQLQFPVAQRSTLLRSTREPVKAWLSNGARLGCAGMTPFEWTGVRVPYLPAASLRLLRAAGHGTQG
jgi:hypothetical protein